VNSLQPPGQPSRAETFPARLPGASLRSLCSRWAPALIWLNVFGLLAAGVWLRLQLLGNLPGLNGDEAWYGVQAMRLLRGEGCQLSTPTGNPLNPLFFGPVVLAHWLFGPSIAVLRSVAVLSGLAALVVNWALCRRVFGRRTAVVSTVMLAVLPAGVAYSRFAWDASQSVLVTLPVWYLSVGALAHWQRRRRWLSAASVCLLVALLVHPANVFALAAPLAAGVTAWEVRRRSAAGRATEAPGELSHPGSDQADGSSARRASVRPRGWFSRGQISLGGRRLGVLLLGAVALVGLSLAAISWADTAGAQTALSRIAGPSAWLRKGTLARCVALTARLFVGGTIYQYLAGSSSYLQWPHAANGLGGPGLGLDVWSFWAAVLASCWAIARRAAKGRAHVERALAGGCLLGVLGYWLAIGPAGMVPGYERYALWMVVPLVILVSRGMELWAGSRRARRRLALLGLAAGWLVVADFQAHYFRFVQHTGGRAHHTFVTAQVDPKQAAAELILFRISTPQPAPANAQTSRPATTASASALASRAGVPEPDWWIVTSEWWSEWALRYFTIENPRIHVLGPSDAPDKTPPRPALAQGRVFWVEFAQGKKTGQLPYSPGDKSLAVWPVRDYAGGVVLWVFQRRNISPK